MTTPPGIGTIGWGDLTVADLDASMARCTALGGRRGGAARRAPLLR